MSKSKPNPPWQMQIFPSNLCSKTWQIPQQIPGQIPPQFFGNFPSKFFPKL
jgi:hypothetical protein